MKSPSRCSTRSSRTPASPSGEVRQFIDRRLLGDPKLVEFTAGPDRRRQGTPAQIDEMIKEVAENWRLDRMAAIDRNILRLGAYEMLFRPEVPAKVAINEALELAKRYSTAQSSRFVNGILDRVLQLHTAPAGGRPQARARVQAASEAAGLPGATSAVRPFEPGRPPPSDSAGPEAPMTEPAKFEPRIEASPCGSAQPGSRTGRRSARAHDALRRRLLALRGGRRRGRVGLAALAITDHDTVSALPIARPEADRLGIELVTGVELTCASTAASCTSWAISSATTTPDLREAHGTLRAGRARRLEIDGRAAARTRLAVELDLRSSPRLPSRGAGPAAPGRYLARTGQVASVREAFARYLGDGRPAASPSPGWTSSRRSA